MMNFFIFIDIGNEIADIDIDLLRLSLYVGTIFSGLALLVSFRLRDSKSLTAEEEGSVASEFENNTDQVSWKSVFAPNAFKVIGITVLSAMIISFGAGTSVPYFPRFFFDIYRLDLSDLSLAFAALTVITAVWGKVTANLGDRYSRVKIIFVNQFMAVILLYFLSTYPPLGVAISVLFVRNAVMNAAGPLNNAVIMEFTPRKYRSMTFSLMQISWSFTFGLGQIFGGRLVDAVGFRIPFIITASLYLIASLIYLWIERYDTPVKKDEDDKGKVLPT
jgi:predicted MFS family arabinose efflux permease